MKESRTMRRASGLALFAASLFVHPASPVAWWSFEEGPGQPVKDSSGSRLTGKLVGNIEFIAGKVGKAIRLDGKSRVEFPSSPPLKLGPEFTISLWFQAGQVPSDGKPLAALVSRVKAEQGDRARGPGYEFLFHREGQLRAHARGASNFFEVELRAKRILDGQWHHLAAVFGSNKATLYIDGIPGSEGSGRYDPVDAELPLFLGWRDGVLPGFVGLLDEVKLWKHALSAAELAAELKSAGGVASNVAQAFKSRDTGLPLSGNQLANGSFEVGTTHWFAQYRENGNGPNAAELAAERSGLTVLSAAEFPGATNGRRALRMPVPEGCAVHLTSAYFPLRFGYPATVSLSVWAPATNRRFELRVGYGRNETGTAGRQVFRVEKEGWQNYSLTFTPPPSPSRGYFLELSTPERGEWLIDAVTVVEGERAALYDEAKSLNVGWEPADSNHPANIFHRDELVRFHVLAETKPGPSFLPLYGRLVNTWGEPVARIDVPVALTKDSLGKVGVLLNATHNGGYKFELYTNAKLEGLPACEISYTVVPKLRPPRHAEQSFFGGHVLLTPYNLHIAARAGFRWLRLCPPLPTAWWSIEKERGKVSCHTEGVERAAERGFRLLGLLGTTPPFQADAEPRRSSSSWTNSGAPRDPLEWQRYVSNVQAVFGPWIKHWELWNEPDTGFFQPPAGKTREQAYLALAAQTRRYLDETGTNHFLVAGAVSTPRSPFFMETLTNGLALAADALSFHYRFEDRDPAYALELLAKAQELRHRSGKPAELWNTAGGPYPLNGWSWLRSARIPATGSAPMGERVGSLVRNLATLKALGVARHFLYQAFAHPSGTRVYQDAGACLVDRNGIPLPTLAAHAAAVFFLEDADGRGLEELPAGETKVTSARFLRAGKAIDVVWSRSPVKLKDVKTLRWVDREAYDVMGNPLALTPEYRLTQLPIYLRTRPK